MSINSFDEPSKSFSSDLESQCYQIEERFKCDIEKQTDKTLKDHWHSNLTKILNFLLLIVFFGTIYVVQV